MALDVFDGIRCGWMVGRCWTRLDGVRWGWWIVLAPDGVDWVPNPHLRDKAGRHKKLRTRVHGRFRILNVHHCAAPNQNAPVAELDNWVRPKSEKRVTG